jgi:Na+/melibiose symporter-like transporter
VGGLISYYFSSHIELPLSPVRPPSHQPFRQRIREYLSLVRGNKPFVSFVTRRFVFITGQSFAAPLFPLFYVHVLDAPDAAIGLITTAATASAMIGYALWVRQSRVRGARFVLLCTTLGLSLYPIIVSFNRSVEFMIVLAGFAGIFSAGLNLVMFDELMKTVPDDLSATFVSLAQMLGYMSAVVAPMLGTTLATFIGISGGLLVGGFINLLGFLLFALGARPQAPIAGA